MGFIKKNARKKEDTDSTEKKEYPFPEDVELKACRYCQVMIPKTAKVCPNCRKRLRKNWLGLFFLLCLLAACAAGAYYYVAVYSVTKQTSADVEGIQSGETVQDTEDGLMAENGAGTGDTGMDADLQIENLPEIPTKLEELTDSELEKSDELMAGVEIEEESEKTFESEQDGASEDKSELEKDDEPENSSEAEKEKEFQEDVESTTERGAESEDAAEEEDRAGMMADADADGEFDTDDESDTEPESGTDLPDGTLKINDIGMYTEEEFRDICKQVDYKKLLRRQELYLDAAVTVELTVMEQVDGGLFDENLYYLCKKEDEQGITRYYIVRDDREEDAEPILEGDVFRVYGQLFGSCKLPGYLIRTQPVVPALTVVYYDLLEE